MSRSPMAIRRRAISLCARVTNVAARLEHEGNERDADTIRQIVQAHAKAGQTIEKFFDQRLKAKALHEELARTQSLARAQQIAQELKELFT